MQLYYLPTMVLQLTLMLLFLARLMGTINVTSVDEKF